ncbi:MAG: C39 family peptidase [Clostridia bacterium]|nr:C39 family peptidase [Clostridia bacterium]
MGFFLANRKKSDSRAKRKAETAKRLEAERKQNPPQTQKKQKQTPQKPAKISVKVAEGSSVVAPKKEVKVKTAEPKPEKKRTEEQPKAEKEVEEKKPKAEENKPKTEEKKPEEPVVSEEKTEASEPEVPAEVMMNPFSNTRILVAAASVLVFSIVFNLCVHAVGNTVIPVPTTAKVTAATTVTTTEATTEEETEPVTQAPEAVYTRSAGSDAPVAPSPEKPKSVFLSIPYVSQLPAYPTGCEAACATMLLRFWGIGASLDSVVASIPRGDIHDKNGKPYGPSIYAKFVGDPRCSYTDKTPGYGAFSPVITSYLWGFVGSNYVVKNVSGSSLSDLCGYLDKGCPLIVWATYNMKQPTTCNWWYVEGTDQYFEYPRGTHVFVLCGYSSGVVNLMDPYGKGVVTYSQSLFSSRYNLLGRQAIVIMPVEQTTESTTEKTTTKKTPDPVIPSTTDESTTDGTTETTTDESTTDGTTETTTAESTTDTTTEAPSE